MRIYAKIFCKTAVFGNNCSGRYIFVATIIAYLRHAICVGDSLPQVGNIYDVTNPGLTTIAYLRHAARSTRPPPIIHPTSTIDAEQSPTTMMQTNAFPPQCRCPFCHNAGERQRCHPTSTKGEWSEQCLGEARLWLTPHSQCRRYWLCGVCNQKRKACRRYAIMVAHSTTSFHHQSIPPFFVELHSVRRENTV